LIVGEYARKIGKNAEFTHEVFKAYFEDCLDIGKEDVIIAISKKTGLTKHDVENA
jgi:predicted DsbA family dithiol-disulfide isomerase